MIEIKEIKMELKIPETYYWSEGYTYTKREEIIKEFIEEYLTSDFTLMFHDGDYAEIENKNTKQRYSCYVVDSCHILCGVEFEEI